MTRSEILLAVMAAGGEEASFSVVQIQKLAFLIDQEASNLIGEHHFQFSPGALGPSDARIDEELAVLVRSGEILVDQRLSVLALSLTPQGLQRGIQVLQGLSGEAGQAITDLTRWVLSSSLEGLLGGIFDRYPEMAANSKIRVHRSRYPRPVDHCSKRPFLRGMARALDFTGALRRDFSMWTDIEYEAAGIESAWEAVGDALRAVLPSAGGKRAYRASERTLGEGFQSVLPSAGGKRITS